MDFISSNLAVEAQKNPDSDNPEIIGGDVYFTFSEQQDEQELYSDLNSRLTQLEAQLEVDAEELAAIRESAAHFRLHIDEQKEVLMRIDWLERMYHVKAELPKADSAERAAKLQTLLAPVQSCPLKKQLMESLKTIKQTEPNNLMGRALKQAGETFINLGKAGREFVIAQAGETADMDHVRKLADELEQRVKALRAEKDARALAEALSSLPLKSMAGQTETRKSDLAHQLVNEDWNSLMALDRKIAQTSKQLDKQELEQNPFPTTIEAGKLEQLLRDGST